VILILSVVFFIGEILIRIISPQPYMYPRWEFSNRYGNMLFADSTMINECPGRWRYVYTINSYQYRGKAVPISNVYSKKNIVVLGDSYSFGQGVNDGYEYPAVIAGRLKDGFDVVNLSVGGWGLTQEIRRFYEFGQLYNPRFVILQFCSNDPADNFVNAVTTVENDRFVFRDSNSTINWIKKYMSRSIAQKSQIYNLFRNRMYQYFSKKIRDEAKASYETRMDAADPAPAEEKYYCKLLELFAKDLNKKGIELIFISVNGQLDQFKKIKSIVLDLDARGELHYIDIGPWFTESKKEGVDLTSPEGHAWNEKAHRILGERLSEVIKTLN
jgi:hypothetical protein